MNKNFIKQLLDALLIPVGYKKKGNYWVDDTKEIIRTINLQKSNFGDNFYINYGYTVKSLALNNGKMHIFRGLGSIDKNENEEIKALLDLRTHFTEDERSQKLTKILKGTILKEFNLVTSEKDLLNHIKKMPNKNGVPINVKQYFNLI